jgi:hypothetical protein
MDIQHRRTLTYDTNMDMKHELNLDMKHGHGHAALTWTCSMDLVMQHGLGHAEANGHAPWMLEYRMADKKLSSGIVILQRIPASWSVKCRRSRASPLVPGYV